MRTVIFDLDGTLADTAGDLVAAANACFRGLGHGDLLDAQADKAVALRGGRSMLTLGFDRLGGGHDAIDGLYPVLLEHYGENICVHSVLYPGVSEAVAGLRDEGYAVGICTNKPEALAEALMAALGARDWFASLIGADTLPVRKPDPVAFWEAVDRAGGSRAQALLVGDTATDRETARAAGVPSVLVTFGSGEDVGALEPEGLLSDYGDLGGLVRRLIG